MKIKLFFLLLIFLLLSSLGVREFHLEEGHRKMCLTLQKDFVEGLSDQELEDCFQIYKRSFTLKKWEQNMTLWFSNWNWSHLGVYAPVEVDQIWNSQIENIGVKLKVIEGEYVVYRAHPKSIFEKGDIILSIDEEIKLDFDKIMNSGGVYRVERAGEVLDLSVEIKDYQWNDNIFFKDNLIWVPSFRGEFFTDGKMKILAEELKRISFKDNVILDLRDNYGGNIAAGIRLMSLFICKGPRRIGKFLIPSRKGKGESSYPLSIDQSVQVEHLKKYETVYLDIGDSDNFCYAGDLKVLINSNTSSTAEMVAQAMIDFKRAKVVGQISSGRMVLSSWESVEHFPKGYEFAYPYAIYRSSSGKKIEGVGVQPHVYKDYVLKKEKRAVDSFL